jgi:crotonobetainyl-CoA:carnitine CoA-transferase CaiB-like acyl-CoA transferase
MSKPPLISHRRIDHLKARAFDCGFSNEDAKQFGKLSKTATWEALLETNGIPLQAVDTVDTVDTNIQSLDTSGWTNDGSFPGLRFYPS